MENERESNSVWGFVVEVVKFAVLAALIVLPIRIFIAQPFIVKGESMVPTFDDGEYLIVDEISYYAGEPKRGDVVIFRYPKDPSKYFIKRIIGLPGDTVVIEDGSVKIRAGEGSSGLTLEETYVTHASRDNLVTTLGKGEYFVMGDNRRNSLDSRVWGALPRENIIGRAFLRLFPPDEIGVFPGAVQK